MLQKIKEITFVLSGKLASSTQSTIVFYHDVHLPQQRYTDMSTDMSLFKEHMAILKAEGYAIVPKIEQEQYQIQVCFDDGFRGIYDNKEYFIEQQIYPTVFLAISLIGQEGYLTEEEIIELQTLGFIFESHAYAHENLTTFNDAELKYELEASKSYLESLLNKPVNEICFPIGYFSDRVLKFCKEAGYTVLYSSLPGRYFNKRTDGLVYRNLVQFSSPKEFKAIVKGAMDSFLWWYRKKQYVKTEVYK
ncbi:polysaccharide deacetylase family protein [Psychroserpens algicola]|uniref:Polysaccharide deacetylase family protein n=1 Tax=Psychroserpens algicola TaxID=1719034 RepID=A0ABT0H862_9FLAO|nr:polysaccharide deacetylase family protein [Psychroserpens algicola]MCK8480554.1 polysaccharide deacetylase family protein [Psychroserpens algicola]